MTNEEIHEQLGNMADDGYRKFMAKLTPNINPDTILGIRTPQLRSFAKQLAKDDWRTYLDNAVDDSFEEILLQGMVIGNIKAELDVILPYVINFIPKIDNWAVCDSFCVSLKLPLKYPAEMWNFLQPYLIDERVYHIRFGIVMLLAYYVNEQYIRSVFEYFDKIKSEDYYVKMAVAWAVSVCYFKFPDITMKYLKNNQLDDFTYNKSLQKIRESRKIDEKTKKNNK
jgi:Predicted DNA alkylation repair enzyme